MQVRIAQIAARQNRRQGVAKLLAHPQLPLRRCSLSPTGHPYDLAFKRAADAKPRGSGLAPGPADGGVTAPRATSSVSKASMKSPTLMSS